ncbi:hypothetical protein [Mycobacterium nebraskense]|uniref:Uncharacterized protein n=1 Tax=Mycobacterium nebraskense TaxID=244292 RepID=A0A0F5N916_9MYCO|nr:hypothetical protein [Mycobacterium nebraskense]KKC03330.1 hypothetical protein WU83_19585 [Mycobacterium nebraskense]KLO39970.1 hypothetical protein ABW17_18530 [Mycobacterium nebraskense]MBI2695977.1 hypothetical protein [Mycobacterium nebraskense]MCV7120616.1 hypothetical protein [Mycobacterium nebraskense]ORW19213.1 hypothetical protein AWC17_09490 [Mycobacterium nebraskense]
MVRQEGGRWDVGIKDNAVYLERVSEGDERLFDDSLASDEARKLAELLTKFADKLDGTDESTDSDKSKDAKDSKDSKDSEDADESKDAEDSKDSEDSDKSSD